MRKKAAVLLIAGAAVAALAYAIRTVADEVRTSRRQAAWLAGIAADLHYRVEPGPSDAIAFPRTGPYDERLGYRQLPEFAGRLRAHGYEIAQQARMSPRMLQLHEHGLFAIYHEKSRAGLDVVDCRGATLSTARYPQRGYDRFESIPPMLVDALLFIEDRDLLDPAYPTRNPTLDWERLGRAALDQAHHLIDRSHQTAGGSTLATQIEKYRHSPAGRTESMKEKLRQMASASLRAYLDGEDTSARRRQIVVDYLNTVPLAARAGIGEVHGLGDGMWAWYGRDFAQFNRLLADADGVPPTQEQLQQQALAFKQALSLMIAQRRPSTLLAGQSARLSELTNSYLRIMAQAGVVSPALRDAALPLQLVPAAPAVQEPAASFVERKGATAMRTQLGSLLDVPRVYDLDRIDLAVTTTLDSELQRVVTDVLRSLGERTGAKAAGLYGFRLLKEADDPGPLMYSLTLLERRERMNVLRVQTDNVDQPFDLNEGARLDLGSTAKLRTLITYLELVAALHERWHGLAAEELAELELHARDGLSRWVRDHLSRAKDRSLEGTLEAAMQRKFSASPHEGFFTGGGVHTFENFDKEHDRRIMTVADAFRHSVNLVFIRLMRDIVQHVMYTAPNGAAEILSDPTHERRRELLVHFADVEGRRYLSRFYGRYAGKSPDEAEDLLLRRVRPTAPKLASVLFAIDPDADIIRLAAVLEARLQGPARRAALEAKALQSLYDRYSGDRLSLADRGYVASIHPLELWLVAHLRTHPGATLADVVAASTEQRQKSYAWLFKTRHRSAQDARIRTLLEREAFAQIQRAWQRLGYPFEALTPSYATAIGASGDRPAALAELMGILSGGGVRRPVAKIDSLVFARDTPYETRLEFRPPAGEQVLAPAIVDVVRRALIDVVEEGTARRLKGALMASDGARVPIGGKTGTGDHRFDVFGRGGRLVESRIVSRSATFAFVIGDRWFGTLVAYVREPDAAKYKFTSALPAQLLKSLVPALRDIVDRPPVASTPQRAGSC